MKQIGYTRDNGVIVELTEGEWRTLKMLNECMDGKEYKGANITYLVDGRNMAPAFQAIAAWIDTSISVGQLQDVVDSLKRSLVPPTLREKVQAWEGDS